MHKLLHRESIRAAKKLLDLKGTTSAADVRLFDKWIATDGAEITASEHRKPFSLELKPDDRPEGLKGRPHMSYGLFVQCLGRKNQMLF